MNDPLDMVRELADRARHETPPRGNVLPRTLEQLRQAESDSTQRIWRVFAACACGVALVAAIGLTWDYRSKVRDPMQTFFLSYKLPEIYS